MIAAIIFAWFVMAIVPAAIIGLFWLLSVIDD